MADPFSIASGAAGIVSLGLTIAKALFLVADGIGSAGVEVRCHAEEVDSFSKLLDQIRIKLDECSSIYPEIRSLVGEVVRVCGKVLTPLRDLRNHLEPLSEKFRRSPNRLKQLGLRMGWVFRNKNKILFYRDALKQQHGVLDTIISLMTLQMVKNRDQTNMNLWHMSLQNSLASLAYAYRANQQLTLEAELRGPLPGPESRALIAVTESTFCPQEAIRLPEHRTATSIAWSAASSDDYRAVASDDCDEELSEQDVLDMVKNIVHGYDSVPPETVQDIRNEIGVLQRNTIRLSASIRADADLGMNSRDIDPLEYRIPLICTGKTIYVAVMALLDEEQPEADSPLSVAQIVYTLGRLGNHNVIVVYLVDEMSTSHDGLTHLLSDVQRRYRQTALSAVMIGFGNHNPHPERAICLGDVVVSAPWDGSQGIALIDSSLNRYYPNTNPMKPLDEGQKLLHIPLVAAARSLAVRHEIRGNDLDDKIVHFLKKFSRIQEMYSRPSTSSDRKRCYSYIAQGEEDPNAKCRTCWGSHSQHGDEWMDLPHTSQVHLGRIAFADSTWKSDPHEHWKPRWKNEIGDEVFCFGEVVGDVLPDFPCLVICGVRRYADSDPSSPERKKWEGYAAMMAAIYTKELLIRLG